MKPEYNSGDILIKRVSNGWIAVSGCVHLDKTSEEDICFHVYEDTEIVGGERESLCNLIKSQFEYYMQSKRSCGMLVSFSGNSRELEEEIEFLSQQSLKPGELIK